MFFRILILKLFAQLKRDDKCPPWTLKAKKIKHDRIKKTIYYEHATLKIYDIPIKLIMYFITIVSVFNIGASLWMIIIEKTRDFGILQSMGLSKLNIFYIILFSTKYSLLSSNFAYYWYYF